MMTRHLQAVPAASGVRSIQPACLSRPPSEDEAETFTSRGLAELLSRAQPGAGEISVQRFERDDGTLIIYIDAGDVVAFIYAGRPATADTQADGPRDPVVLDVHLRTEAGEQRLHVLVDGVPARLLRLDPTQFQIRTAAGRRRRGSALACLRCGSRIRAAGDLLHALLEAAAAHRCPAQEAESCG
ncbi:hypothetical protein [Sphaerisporangium sp. NPDC051011]|uniref:hypothetical protein n=1 Tax=Sphaerisporangium sp. NPDC051011 TaxID=3155792 RepID=UPI0033E46D77